MHTRREKAPRHVRDIHVGPDSDVNIVQVTKTVAPYCCHVAGQQKRERKDKAHSVEQKRTQRHTKTARFATKDESPDCKEKKNTKKVLRSDLRPLPPREEGNDWCGRASGRANRKDREREKKTPGANTHGKKSDQTRNVQ